MRVVEDEISGGERKDAGGRRDGRWQPLLESRLLAVRDGIGHGGVAADSRNEVEVDLSGRGREVSVREVRGGEAGRRYAGVRASQRRRRVYRIEIRGTNQRRLGLGVETR